MNTLLAVSILPLLLGVTGATNTTNTTRRIREPCNFDRNLNGWEFFNRNLTFWMLQRNYNVSENLNDSICVWSWPPKRVGSSHSLRSTFEYRNLSSTFVLPETNATLWPGARITLNFTQYRADLTYIYAREATINSWFGYNLPPINWRFLYTGKNCSVVQVLPEGINENEVISISSTDKRKVKCELWQTSKDDYTPITLRNKTAKCCKDFFQAYCDTSTIYQVYDSTRCNRFPWNKSSDT